MKKLAISIVFLVFSPLSLADIVVKNAWVKNAPPVAPARAAYLTISNTGNKAVTINKVSSKQFSMVEMHETSSNNGVFSMQELHNISIPAFSSVQFKPMGKHVMLMMPKQSLHGLKQIELQLHYSNNQVTTVTAPVKDSL